MLMTLAGVIGLAGCALLLAISLLILPVTLAASIVEHLGTIGLGQYRLPALGALIVAVPFGLAFGATVVRRVALKSLGTSLVAALLIILFAVSQDGLRTSYAREMLLECGVFVALFCAFAMAGNWIFRRVSQGPRIAGGSLAFLVMFGLLTAMPFVRTIVNARIPVTPDARLARAQQQIHDAKSDTDRFYALNDAAKLSFVLGHVDDARQFSDDLLRTAAQHRRDWNYGNAIHDGNMVLGRIAVREGRIGDAKQFLLKAGATPGSPQLNSFGPNMSLAKDLLDRGERDVVLEYFELCRKFWEMNRGQLDAWSKDVRAGEAPDFGANLLY